MTKAVVYTASRNLYPYMVYSLRSLLENGNVDKIFFIIEDDQLPFEVPNSKIINVGDLCKELFPDGSPNANIMFTRMVLMRALTARIVPSDLDTILQLDVDTIICDDLSPIWDIDLTGKYFAATQEFNGAYKPYGEKYYNIGVMLFNLKYIRASGIDLKISDAMNREKFIYGEQDAWNKYALPNNMIADLPVRYNETEFTGFTDHPAIVHFAGVKNWYESPHYMARREYLEMYRQAGDVL